MKKDKTMKELKENLKTVAAYDYLASVMNDYMKFVVEWRKVVSV